MSQSVNPTADEGQVTLTVHPPERGRSAAPVTLACGCCCCCCCCLHTIGSAAGGLVGSLLPVAARPLINEDPSAPFPFRRDVFYDEEEVMFSPTLLYWSLVGVLTVAGSVWFFLGNGNLNQPEFLLYGFLVAAIGFLPFIQLGASLLACIGIAVFYTDKRTAFIRLGKITLWSFVGGLIGMGTMVGFCVAVGALNKFWGGANTMSGTNGRRRLRRVAVLAALVLGTLAILIGAAVARGTWADDRPRLPERVEDGAICHVCEPPGQPKHVRCAMLVPFPMEEVWLTVTDYEHLGDLCPCLEFGEVVRDPDGTCRLKAQASSGLPETVPFALKVREEQTLHQYHSSWDQASGNVTVNRGGWTLTSRGPSLTLVELRVEVQMDHVPTFILRNLNLQRVADTVRGVEQRLRTGAAKTW